MQNVCFPITDDCESNTTGTDDVAHNVPPGEHLLHCEVLASTSDPGGGHEFRIVAVDSA